MMKATNYLTQPEPPELENNTHCVTQGMSSTSSSPGSDSSLAALRRIVKAKVSKLRNTSVAPSTCLVLL